MKDLRQYGISVMTLTDLVDDFCLAQGNMREAVITASYRNARWAWKDIFRTTLWYIRKAVLCINCKDHTIRLPDDCERVINISVVDCHGKLHPLGFNTDFNTTKITCLKVKCGCNKCRGEDTLCGAIDSIQVVTETVVINSVDYTKTTWTRYDGSGAVQIEQQIPTWDVAQSKVVFNTLVETICNVETTENGCIKATQANMNTLRENCGCGNFLDNWNSLGFGWGNYNLNRELIPAPYNYWGEWNYNSQDRQIIHLFGNARQGSTHFNQTEDQEREWRGGLRQVILEYQTNGETPNAEILIPEYAVEAVQMGIFYRQKYFSPRIPAGERMMAKNEFMAEKIKVAKYLNPVIMENVTKLQTNPRYW